MAGPAIRAKFSGMVIILGMAGKTVLRGAQVDPVLVAAFTSHTGVFAIELEHR